MESVESTQSTYLFVMASKGVLGLETSRKTTTTKLQKEKDEVYVMNENHLHLIVDLNLCAACPVGI